jgi:AraC-like DNA-binding protein
MLTDLIAGGHRVRLSTLPRGRIGVHAMPIGAGLEKRQNELYSWEGLSRGEGPFLLMQHTIAGRGELDYAGVRHGLCAGTTMVLTTPHRHRYWLDRGRSWEYFWVGVNGSEALRIGRAVLERHGPVLRLGAGAIDRLAGCCRAILSDPLPVGAASAAAYGAVMALYDGVASDEEDTDADAPAPVRRARALVEQDLSAPLGVERLARAAGLSRAHFVRLFARTTGEAPSAYVFRMRLERAARLLVATDAPIGEVARQTGFASANYFAKAFLRANGTTPSAYRASGGG